MTKLVFLDIETTGLDPQRNEILEVAMITRQDSEDEEVNFSLDFDFYRADPKALEVNKYAERHEELREIQVPELMAGVKLFRRLKDAVVVGNNVQFDLRFVEHFFRTRTPAKNPTPWHYHPVDLKALVAGWQELGPPPWRTPDIAAAAGMPLPEDAHTALADARWNRDVYDVVYA